MLLFPREMFQITSIFDEIPTHRIAQAIPVLIPKIDTVFNLFWFFIEKKKQFSQKLPQKMHSYKCRTKFHLTFFMKITKKSTQHLIILTSGYITLAIENMRVIHVVLAQSGYAAINWLSDYDIRLNINRNEQTGVWLSNNRENTRGARDRLSPGGVILVVGFFVVG